MDLLLDATTMVSDAAVNGSAATMSVHANDESPNARNVEPPPMSARKERLLKNSRTSPHRPDVHQCRICHRTYRRADRLSRHFKSHENARRYICHSCKKGFNRADLLARHVLTHERIETGQEPSTVVHRIDRTSQACLACAAAKARCEDQKPCRRCLAKNIVCHLPSSTHDNPQQRAKSDEQTNIVLQSKTERKPHDGQDFEEQPSEQQPLRKSLLPDSQPPVAFERSCNSPPEESAVLVDPFLAQLDANHVQTTSIYDSQFMCDNIVDDLLFTPNVSSFNYQNFDIDFQEIDFQLPSSNPLPDRNNNEGANSDVIQQASRPARDVHAGHVAFTRSPWLWTPATRDYILRDGEDLTIDEGSVSSALSSPLSFPIHAASGAFPVLNATKRDEMYYLISTMTTYTRRIPRIPSLDILNRLIEAFLVRHASQIDHWLHVPNMSWFEVIPELNLALVIGGSTTISMPSICKLGHLLQDVVRVKLGELWERQNSATRKLQPLQAWMLFIDGGLWSGFQRQMELAESFEQTMITMVRRSGIFGASTDTQALIPLPTDTGLVLEAKWKKWVQLESFKRLAIHLFLHDAQASIALHKSPIISVTEITTSLPAPRNLFLAESAEEWKSCFYDQKFSLPPPSIRLIDIVRDVSMLDDFRAEVDVNLCYLAAIYAFWSQIWAFRDAWEFHFIGNGKHSVHHLWLITQQHELYQQLRILRTSLYDMQEKMAELLIVVELLLMILHVSPEELQRFAGKHGEEAASQGLASLERWSSTEQARKAVWHAGQVFRWASSMSPGELRDFNAIAVYLAGLLLWVYGHLLISKGTSSKSSEIYNQRQGASATVESKTLVIINDEETSSARSFLAGRPANLVLSPVRLRDEFNGPGDKSTNYIRLEEPTGVLKMTRELYRNNYLIESEALPPLVINMGNLMSDLSNLPEKWFSRHTSPVGGG